MAVQGVDELELAGRIDALSQALLRVVATLEISGHINGADMTAAWRRARPAHLAATTELRASRKALHQLADRLDEARVMRSRRAGPECEYVTTERPCEPARVVMLGPMIRRREARAIADAIPRRL